MSKRPMGARNPAHEPGIQKSIDSVFKKVQGVIADTSTLKGRAIEAWQKRKVIEGVLSAWLSTPTLRLGQLIVCAIDKNKDLFYVEDEALIKDLEDFCARNHNTTTK